jgi:hypothetical protein
MVVLFNWEIIDIRPVHLLASSNFSHIALSFLLPRLLSMAEPQPYSGPIFDVQAHAIKPSGYEAVATGIRNKTSLERGTVATIADHISKELADDLQGGAAWKS